MKIGSADYLSSRLSHEYNVYTELAGSAGVSPVRWYGKEGSYEVIVMDHLGTSLGDLISGGHVDHGEVFQYAPQMVCSRLNKYNLLYSLTHTQLSAVESLHTRHYVHRDIKPANFTVQVDNLQRTVSLIDFGLAQLFRNPATYLHNPGSTGHPVVGTLPFTSIAGQRGFAQSRRDDLESLAYTIIHSARGDLPWTVSANSDHEAVLQKKMSITTEELCEGLPAPFCEFIDHVRSLGFDQKPDYQLLHSILLLSATEIDHPSKTLPSLTPPPANINCAPVSSGRVCVSSV